MLEIAPQSRWKVASVGTYTFLLITLFVTELAVMEVGSPLLLQLSPWSGAFVDAAILVVVFCLPLLLFCLRLIARDSHPQVLPWSLYLRVLLTIFLIEVLVMLQLQLFKPFFGLHSGALLDASATVLLSAPPLWWLFRRLEQRYGPVALADYLQSPPMLLLLLLFLIFFADLLQELLRPLLAIERDSFGHKVLHSSLGTLFISPILWALVARPLRQSARAEQFRTRAVYAQVVDAVITFDAQGLIECFNPGAQRIFGYTGEEMIRQPVARLFKEGQQILDRLVQETVPGELGSRQLLSHELLGRRSDGALVTMDVSISQMRLQGKVEYLLIMRDITERRLASAALEQSEARFRQIFEQTDDGIIFLDPVRHAVLDINSVTFMLLGYRIAELQGQGLEPLFRPEDLPRVHSLLEGVGPRNPAQLDPITARRKDGSEILVSLRIKGMTLGAATILYCTLRDVTARVRLEAEAREIQSKLIQVNKMTALGLMVSGVAHEINNPNNFILSNAQMLEQSWQDASKVLREYCEENGDVLLGGIPFSRLDSHAGQLFGGIVDGSRRIGEIVKNLKGFARQESVALEHRVDINQIAQAAISILHHEIKRFTANFRFEPGGDLPLLQGNRQQLGQVVVNLLMNACQALPEKNLQVLLQTYWDPGTGEVVLAVKDEGVGLSAEVARNIMEPFFTTKLESGGTGLGLAICRSIVQEHQGRLEFTSEPGNGTTFFLRLPALAAESEGGPR